MAYLEYPDYLRKPKPWPFTPPPDAGGWLNPTQPPTDTRQRTVTPPQPPELDTSAIRGRLAKDTPIATTNAGSLNELGRLRAQQQAIEKAPSGYEVKPMRGELGPEWQTVPRKKHGRLFEALVTGLEGAGEAARYARPGQEIGAVIGGFGTGAAMGGVSPKFRQEYEKQRAEAQVAAKIEQKQQQEMNEAKIRDIEAQARQRAQGTGKIVKGADGQEYVVYGDQAKPITRSDTGEAVKGTTPTGRITKAADGKLYRDVNGVATPYLTKDGEHLTADVNKKYTVRGADGQDYQVSGAQALAYANGEDVEVAPGHKIHLTPGQEANFFAQREKIQTETEKAQAEVTQLETARADAGKRNQAAAKEIRDAREVFAKTPKPSRTMRIPNAADPTKMKTLPNPDFDKENQAWENAQQRLQDAKDEYRRTQDEMRTYDEKLPTARAKAQSRPASPQMARPKKGGGKYVKPRVSDDDVKRVLGLP